MEENDLERSYLQPEKRRKIHVGLVECTSYSQTEKGSATLRHPVDRNAPRRDPQRWLQPRPRTRRGFQIPRRAVEGASVSASQSLSAVSERSTNLGSSAEGTSDYLLSQAAPDRFDSDGDDREMVEQSSDKSIELLSVLGGFKSAAELHGRPCALEAASAQTVSAISSLPQSHYQGAQCLVRPQRKSIKKWEKDANQKSIIHFIKSSPDIPENEETPFPDQKIMYGSPSKMYSPIKKVSEHVYVISDEDSPSSQEKTSGQNASSSLTSASTSSFVKKLFSGQKKAEEETRLSSRKGRSKSRNSKMATAKSSGRQPGLSERKELSKSKKDFLYGSGQNDIVVRDPALKLDIDFGDWDKAFQPASSSNAALSAPSVKREVMVGKTYGLLGDSKMKEVRVNYFEQMPLDVVENIFCRLPMLDLCLNMSLVCTAWNDVISNEKFIPWKKLYHRLKLGEEAATKIVQGIISAEDMSRRSSRLLHLISYLRSFKRVSKENNMDEMLQQHPKYSWAVALMKERASHCFIDQDPNPWSLLCALVLVAASVQDVSLCLNLLTSARSRQLSAEILECLYCMATLLLAFRLGGRYSASLLPENESLHHFDIVHAQETAVVNGIHYRLFYALYLFENASVSNHAMLQEALAGQSGQQSIVRYSRGETEVRLTHEQMRIVKYTPAAGEVVKIFAFAGSGKTTTLVRYAQMRPNLKFLLIVFNKSVQEHAKGKFPPNVTCKTTHGLAFGYTGRKYAAENQLSGGNMKVYEILQGLPEREKGEKENLFIRAKFVMTTLKNYLASAEDNITTRHTPDFIVNDDGVRVSIPHEKRMRYAEDAEHYWGRMVNLRDRLVKMTHDGYLKLFQLGRHKLRGYDMILVDEAQDLTPAVLDMIQSQTQPRVFVGDQHQQIYAFRGAVNAMAGVEAGRVFYLTQSFRFGPEVSQVANTMLESLKRERRKTLVGHGTPGKMNGEQVGQLAILCRTNYQVFAEAVTICVYSDQPVKIAIVGGMESFGFPMLEDIYTLMMSREDRAKEKREIHNRFIARFANIAELEKYATKTNDVELLGKIRIVRTYHHNLPQCISKIRQKSTRDETQADILLSTVHKAKGLEFSTVKVTNDFLDLQKFLEEGIPQAMMAQLPISVEEVNLLYVAVTRAKHALIMSESVYALLRQIGGGGFQLVLSEELKKQGAPFVCEESQNEFEPQVLTLQRQEVTLSSKRVVSSCVYSPAKLVNDRSEYAHLLGDREALKRQDENPTEDDVYVM